MLVLFSISFVYLAASTYGPLWKHLREPQYVKYAEFVCIHF